MKADGIKKLMESLLQELANLPAAEQDTIVTILLEELGSEQRWAEAFANSQTQFARLAKHALSECELMRQIHGWFEDSGMTAAAAAKLLCVPKARFTSLLKSQIGRFPLDDLVEMAIRAGFKIKLEITRTRLH